MNLDPCSNPPKTGIPNLNCIALSDSPVPQFESQNWSHSSCATWKYRLVAMGSLMKSSLRFLLLLSMIEVLALAMSLACSSSTCSTAGQIGKNENGPLGLGEDLLNAKLKRLHRPNLDPFFRMVSGDKLRLTAPTGVKAELIRYDHPHSRTNSSQISMDIKRSLSRARNMKTTSKKMTNGAGDSVDRPLGMHADLASGAPFEYLMKISIGTPAQHLLAVADTGSDLVWLQCTPPLDEQTNRHFEPSHSKTFSTLGCNSKPCHLFAMAYSDWMTCSSSCEYSYYYADNSNTTGDLVMDTLHMKSSFLSSMGELLTASINNFAFGCGHDQYSTSMLYMNSNGVVGLGKGALSFPSQLGAQFGRLFSYCLVDRSPATVKSSPILFGNIAVPTIPGIQYTPFIDNPVYPTYYYIGLEKIEVDSETLDIPSSAFEFSSDRAGEGGTMIDSGTTFTQLVAPAYIALVLAVSSRIKYKRVAGYFDLCHDVTGIPTNQIVVPSISFYFRGGAKLDLPIKNAFILVTNDPVKGKTTMCLAMNNSTDLGFSIIGNYQQTNYHIIYDLQNMRLGFVSKQCG